MPGVLALRGNMVVARSIASPRMVWRFAARESMDALPPSCELCVSAEGLEEVRGVMMGSSRLARMALAVAIAREAGECDSTATRVFHAAKGCGWMGYLMWVPVGFLLRSG